VNIHILSTFVGLVLALAACGAPSGPTDAEDTSADPGQTAGTGEGFRFEWFSRFGWDPDMNQPVWNLKRLDAMIFAQDQVTVVTPWTEGVCSDTNVGPHIWDCQITQEPLPSGSAVVLNVLFEAPEETTGQYVDRWMCTRDGCVEYPQLYMAENDGIHVDSVQIKPLLGKAVCTSPGCDVPLIVRLP